MTNNSSTTTTTTTTITNNNNSKNKNTNNNNNSSSSNSGSSLDASRQSQRFPISPSLSAYTLPNHQYSSTPIQAFTQSITKRARSIQPPSIRPTPATSSSRSASQRSLSPCDTNAAQVSNNKQFWNKTGIDTLLDWYTILDNYKGLHNKHLTHGKKVKDVQMDIAKVVNNAHTAEGLEWTWKDVKNSIGYIKKQHKKAKVMMTSTGKGSLGPLEQDTLRARMIKVCPEFDRLDFVPSGSLLTNPLPFMQTSSNVETGIIHVDYEDDNLDKDLSETEMPENDYISFNGNDTDTEDTPISKRRKTKKAVSGAENIAASLEALRYIAEKQIQNHVDHRNEIRQREVAIEKHERELYNVIMERDAAARKRLDEELAAKKEQFNMELSKEKEEFYQDMARRKEELRGEMDKLRNEREKYFDSMAEIKVLRRELKLRSYVVSKK